MQKGKVGFRFLVPTDQNAAKAIHPTMGSFHDPASGAFSSFFLDGLGFFATTADMSRKPELFQHVSHFLIIIAFIQTHILLFSGRGFGSFDHNVFKRASYQFHVMTIRTFDGQSNRHTVPFGQDAPFDTPFCSIGGVGPAFFFRPMAISPLRHPCSTIPNRSLVTRHTVLHPPAIISRTHLPRPTPKNGRGQ